MDGEERRRKTVLKDGHKDLLEGPRVVRREGIQVMQELNICESNGEQNSTGNI